MEEMNNVTVTENNEVETTKDGTGLGVAIVLGGAALAGSVLTIGAQKIGKFGKRKWTEHKNKKAAKKKAKIEVNIDDEFEDGEFTEVNDD